MLLLENRACPRLIDLTAYSPINMPEVVDLTSRLRWMAKASGAAYAPARFRTAARRPGFGDRQVETEPLASPA